MAERDDSNHEPAGPEPEPDGPGLPPGTGLWMGLTAAVYVGIVLVQLFPFDFGTPRGPLLALANPGWAAIGLQVAVFLPLGVVDGELARRFFRGWGLGATSAVLIALDAVILALICETVQYWIISRASSLSDIIAAALGAVAGYMLSTLWRGHPQ
jgi:glycopeptide antibiotics resistance protein